MFKEHIQNKLLKRMPVTGTGAGLRWYLCPGQEKERGKERRGGGRCLQRQVQERTSSPPKGKREPRNDFRIFLLSSKGSFICTTDRIARFTRNLIC